jgi:multidrug transporter EmrE-like cation transporter
MFRSSFPPDSQLWPASGAVAPVVLIGSNLLFNIVANAGFKLSASSSTWRGFLIWQVVGNLAGFVTVLTLTGLLRFVPLHVAFPVTTGLAVVGVQVIAAGLFFHEAISPAQWMGTLCVVCGIVLISRR